MDTTLTQYLHLTAPPTGTHPADNLEFCHLAVQRQVEMQIATIFASLHLQAVDHSEASSSLNVCSLVLDVNTDVIDLEKFVDQQWKEHVGGWRHGWLLWRPA